MHPYLEYRRISEVRGVLLVLLAVIAFLPFLTHAQNTAKKLTKQDVIDLLTGDVPSDQVASEARKAGISFRVTAAVANEIKAAGGTDELISVLRSLAPHPAATPPSAPPSVAPAGSAGLLIVSTPGLGEVYVDDEPMGTASSEGRLKLTRLAPGTHTVRIALGGYKDYERSVTIAGGGLTQITATLQPVETPVISAPVEAPSPQTGTVLQPSPPAPMNLPGNTSAVFYVAHDHGQGGTNYCVGLLSIMNGVIYYKANNGIHTFEIPLNSIKEVRKNNVYLVGYRAFHIRTKKNSTFNFVALNQQGLPEPPDAVLTAIDTAMGR